MTASPPPDCRLTPLLLIGVVLGSIIVGAATPTEAAGVGAIGALCLAAYKSALDLETLKDISRSAMATTSMVFLILIGAALFHWCLGASVAMN